jgi:hypothetical protein
MSCQCPEKKQSVLGPPSFALAKANRWYPHTGNIDPGLASMVRRVAKSEVEKEVEKELKLPKRPLNPRFVDSLKVDHALRLARSAKPVLKAAPKQASKLAEEMYI